MFLCRSDTCSCFFFCWSRNKTMPCSFFFNFVSVAFTTDDSVCLVFEWGLHQNAFTFFYSCLRRLQTHGFLCLRVIHQRIVWCSRVSVSPRTRLFVCSAKSPPHGEGIFIKITDPGNICSTSFFCIFQVFFRCRI